MMALLNELLESVPEGKVSEIRIGLHWTAVVVEVDGQRQCGLASTLMGDHHHTGRPDVPQAGQLHTRSGLDLARFAQLEQPALRSVGVAALNALLPRAPELWVDKNAEAVITSYGAGKRVAMVGRFPFVPHLNPYVERIAVLEQQPREGELPAAAAPDILPQADVIAITGMTFVNHTLEDLLALCPAHSRVLVLGPSTPLSPILFSYGVDMLSGAVVEAIDPVLRAVEQGANFRQVHQAGVRLVTMASTQRREGAGV